MTPFTAETDENGLWSLQVDTKSLTLGDNTAKALYIDRRDQERFRQISKLYGGYRVIKRTSFTRFEPRWKSEPHRLLDLPYKLEFDRPQD